MIPYDHALVTGGAGFIGSQIAAMLLEKGLTVTVLDNLSVGKEKNIPEGAEFVEGDINHAGTVKALTADCDIVFHQAAMVSIRASLDKCFEDAQTNLMGTLNILRCCENSRVKKFIFASSMAVYADSREAKPVDENFQLEPLSPYGISKLASEKYIHMLCSKSSIASIVLRYFNAFGPKQTLTPYVGVITIFINKLLNSEAPVIFGDGEQLRDFVHVMDIARANILAMEAGITHETMNIGTGIPTSVNQVADLLIQKINPGTSPEKGEAHPEELKISFPDIGRAGDLIGYQPEFTLEDKIDDVINYIRNRPVN